MLKVLTDKRACNMVSVKMHVIILCYYRHVEVYVRGNINVTINNMYNFFKSRLFVKYTHLS